MIKNPYKNKLLMNSLDNISKNCNCNINLEEILEDDKQNFSVVITKDKQENKDEYYIWDVFNESDFLAKLAFLVGTKHKKSPIKDFKKYTYERFIFLQELEYNVAFEYCRASEKIIEKNNECEEEM